MFSIFRAIDDEFELEDMLCYARQLYQQRRAFSDSQRRKLVREPVIVSATIQPADGRFASVGDSYPGVVFDLSDAGISVLSSVPVDTPHMIVSLVTPYGERLSPSIRVTRRSESSIYHLTAGVSVTQIDLRI